MSDLLCRLNRKEIEVLIDSLSTKSLKRPFVEMAFTQLFGRDIGKNAFSEIQRFEQDGFTELQIETLLKVLLADRLKRGESLLDKVRLVWTGPETEGTLNRDTKIVVRELFTKARQSVVVVGFAVYQGREVFSALSASMDANPNLDVSFYLNVQRTYGDSSASDQIVRQFSDKFKNKDWPGKRFPKVFYDPRSVAPAKGKNAVLHAKVIIVDRQFSFVSSANFTEAAQERNIEAGVLIDSAEFANQLQGHFEALEQTGFLKAVPGIAGTK
jgi:hypothetical protein